MDIVRELGWESTVGLETMEERVLRKELKNARAIAASAMSAVKVVNVLVDMKLEEVCVDVDVSCLGGVVSDIRKKSSCQLSDASGLYMIIS